MNKANKFQKIILATSSPYRIKAFSSLGLSFSACTSQVDEYSKERPETSEALVAYLSKLKAEAVATKFKNEIIIGFDSIGEFEEKVLEKPKNKKEAFARIKRMSGKSFQFFTGIYLINLKTNKILTKVVRTDCFLRKVYGNEIKKYQNQDPTYKTYAVGFNPTKYYSSTFIERIEGCYNNFIYGIPLENVLKMLMQSGYKIIN